MSSKRSPKVNKKQGSPKKPPHRHSSDINQNRDGSDISTNDVDVNMPVPASVANLITQVDRNAPPPTRPVLRPPPSLSSQTPTLEISTEYRAVNAKPQQRSFFQRFFSCCSSASSSSSAVTRHRTTGSTNSSSNGSNNSNSSASALNNNNNGSDETHNHNANGNNDKDSIDVPILQDVPPRRHIPSPRKMPVHKETSPKHRGKKLLALDLDETLVHSSFQPVEKASFVISVTIEGIVHNVYVIKRPGCDEFLKRLAEYYEVIIYTASLSKYADPLLDILDIHKVITQRLFRENCVFYDGHYVKDLSLLNREITQTIIVDNSPMSYIFHPENAIDCTSFFDDMRDVELWQIADFLISIRNESDVRAKCRYWRDWCRQNPSNLPNQNGQHQYC